VRQPISTDTKTGTDRAFGRTVVSDYYEHLFGPLGMAEIEFDEVPFTSEAQASVSEMT
jgi:hypothetical protein